MAVPIVVILGVVIWTFTTVVKWQIARNYEYENKIDEETLEKIRRGNTTEEKIMETMDKFRKKQAAEEQARIDASRGKNLFDEVEDRLRNGRKRKTCMDRKFTPDMFHDPVSRMHEELIKKSKLGNA